MMSSTAITTASTVHSRFSPFIVPPQNLLPNQNAKYVMANRAAAHSIQKPT